MKVLITGRGGQLAWELEQSIPSGMEVVCLSRANLDISQERQVTKAVQEFKPDVVINAAAYTAVDKAESEIETAYSVNHDGVKNLAVSCSSIGAFLVHISTDFVFDGNNSKPYSSEAEVNPQGVYGESKLAGEKAAFVYNPNYTAIIRTSWVYSTHGNNFVKTMLRLMSERESLGVVYDQIGSPTYAKSLASAIWRLLSNKDSLKNKKTVLHWSDAGVASWYDFAVAIQDLAFDKGLLRKKIPINAIESSQYPTPAKRPHYSVLEILPSIKKLECESVHWRKQLSLMLDAL